MNGLHQRPQQQAGRPPQKKAKTAVSKSDDEDSWSRGLLGLSFAFAVSAGISDARWSAYSLLLSLGCTVGCWLQSFSRDRWVFFSEEASWTLKATRTLQMVCSCLLLSQDFVIAVSFLCFTVAIIYVTTPGVRSSFGIEGFSPPPSAANNTKGGNFEG